MNFIVPIILIVASAGLFFGYINPAYTGITGSTETADKSVKELQSEEQDYIDALSKTREIELVREGLLTKFNGIKPGDQEKIQKLLPDHIDSVRLIIDVNNRAAKYGMSLAKITLTTSDSSQGAATKLSSSEAASVVRNPSGNNLYDYVKLGFNVTGTYDNFLGFLKELQESLRMIDVTSLSISKVPSQAGQFLRNPQPAGSESYVYSMTIRAYYLK